MTNPINTRTVPSVSITTARTGASAKANELGVPVWDEVRLLAFFADQAG